ncbi:hypothetical protein [Corynebacterium sp.]|uniref:hypothetical protein n=1 Tax=Corynebacterium sp. TaxID=1720 RepID=UPI002649BE83|nr:hypothetical protein [Corynebacterium sp.]MDN5721137.1 hypothetical protein [Corynebacterium sp.]
MTPSYTFRDGVMEEVPDHIVAEDAVIDHPINNTVIIQAGAHLVTRSAVSGTVRIEDGEWEAQADVNGTVDVGPRGRATFFQRVGGTLRVAVGGVAQIAPGAVALGTMRVDGELVNEGTRGVSVHGQGRVDDRPGSRVRQPDEIRPDGSVAYRS